MSNLEVTDVRINFVKDSNILAIGTITLNGAIVVSGIRLYKGKNGYYILFPVRKNRAERRFNVVFPCDNELRELILQEIKNKYISEIKK